MRKYTITTIDKLQPGDQFVKQDDKNEVVFTVSVLKCFTKGKFYAIKGELKMTDIVDKNESIIFLRSAKKK